MASINVPKGNTKEDIRHREEIISQVYRQWYQQNPTKRVFNSHLKEYINVRFLSINETKMHAALRYESTLAVLQLDLILRSAHKVGKLKPTKPNNQNQRTFHSMMVMECTIIGIGKVKMTVGVKKSGEKIQYCITAIQT